MFLVFLLLQTATLFAQEPLQPIRLELPFLRTETSVEVISLPDSSLLVYHKTGNIWSTKADFYFTKYNHKLEKVWSNSAEIPPKFNFIRHYIEMPYAYAVFDGDDPEKYVFTRTNIRTGATSVKQIELKDIDTIHEFNVLQGNYFLIGQNRLNQKPLLLYLNPSTDKFKQLPAVYGEESSFSDMLADPENNRLDVVLAESNGRISRLQVKSFDATGELIRNYFILQQEGKNLLNAEITPGDSAQKLLLGTYSARDLRYTAGFFTKPVSTYFGNGNFYSMLQLKNSFKYLKPRREERTRARELERLKTGKEPLYRFRVLLHDLITTPSGYLLAGEAYYPQYRGNAVAFPLDTRQAFRQQNEGFKHTHVVAMSFDKDGNLLWDNIFPLKDVTTSELVHAVEVGWAKDGRVIMAYPDNEKIIYHIMQEDRFNDKEHEFEIRPYFDNEKIQLTENPGIIKWYDNNFVAFGFQRVKPAGAEPRNVFYLNKISF